LSRTNIFNLLIYQLISIFFCNKLISQSEHNKINRNKKSFKKKSTKKIQNTNIIKIIQTDNIFSTNILIFCDNIYKSKNSILLFFVKFENIKN